MKLTAVIEELVEEKGLDRETLREIVQEGMLSAYEKKYPYLTLRATCDNTTGELVIEVEKVVVATPEDEDEEISLRKARNIKADVAINDLLWVPFDGSIGRIEILRAKQVIATRIREVEALAVYNEFKDKEGTIVHGVIHKCERNGTVVSLQDHLAFLPHSLAIPGEKCVAGYSIRALLKEVLTEPRNEFQLILDRSSSEFLESLFELEIPEVYERLVEIKKIVRTPGYKAKVLVSSNDSNIDPVGTCVGVGGVRIKPILKELAGEKIDIIQWADSTEELVKLALKPAQVNRVEFIDNENVRVWLDEEQRSLAIGKMGQNINLAARLTGIKIHLVQNNRPDEEISADNDEL